MSRVIEDMRKQAVFIRSCERVVLRRWLRRHVAEVHLNNGLILGDIEHWDVDELARTVECHGGEPIVMLEKAREQAVNKILDGGV